MTQRTLASHASKILICIGLEMDLEVEQLARELPQLADEDWPAPTLELLRDSLLERRIWGPDEEAYVLAKLNWMAQLGQTRVASPCKASAVGSK